MRAMKIVRPLAHVEPLELAGVDARGHVEDIAEEPPRGHRSRRIKSPGMFSVLLGLLISTIGESPDTVIVSARLPTFMTISMLEGCCPRARGFPAADR